MAKKYVVVETWIGWKTVEAESVEEAYEYGEPVEPKDLTLSSWHVVVEELDTFGGIY